MGNFKRETKKKRERKEAYDGKHGVKDLKKIKVGEVERIKG